MHLTTILRASFTIFFALIAGWCNAENRSAATDSIENLKNFIALTAKTIGKDDEYKKSYSITQDAIKGFDCSGERSVLLAFSDKYASNNDVIAKFIESSDALEVYAAAKLALNKDNIVSGANAYSDIDSKQKFLQKRHSIISAILNKKIAQIRSTEYIKCNYSSTLENILQEYLSLITSEIGSNFRTREICTHREQLSAMHMSLIRKRGSGSDLEYWESMWKKAQYACI